MPSEPSAFFDQHLRSFVPPETFDAHLHLYRGQDATPSLPAGVLDAGGHASWLAYRQSVGQWMGDRCPHGGLAFTIPKKTLDVDGSNRFVADEVARVPEARGLLMIRPDDDPNRVAASLDADHFAGFKVYHVFADVPETFQATTDAFLPDWAWELADRRGLAIMLHIVRARALADPVNQAYLHERCLRYPQARLILAHAARGFCGHHTVEGIASLRGIENVYFDTSAVCEAAPLEAILRAFGPRRLLFGTDFPVSEMPGRCVSIGDGFAWLFENNVKWDESAFAKPTLVGIESLLALKQACRTMRLDDRDVEAIFAGNARQLLRISPPSDGSSAQSAYRRAKEIIPGGTQLLSKRPEMYAPGVWPPYYREARGCEVIDAEGRRFIDMTTMGIGSCLLGYADPDVTDAVVRRVQLGSMCTLNSPEELELAELLLQLHPWAEQARFTRAGGESMAVAVRLARAATGRERVAFCGYHGWSDWYLAANLPGGSAAGDDPLAGHLLSGLSPRGVPAGLGGTALPFGYNKLDELARLVRDHGRELAAIVMEPTRNRHPEPGFLEGARALADTCGAALVFDEISAGWRFALGGAHLRYGVTPDLAVFAKALGNGHPIGAVIGRAKIMQAAQESFVSSTYWTEGVGPAAALATIRKLQSLNAPTYVEKIGEQMRSGWMTLGKEHSVPAAASGHAALLSLSFEHPQALALGTLVTARMLDHGFLLGGGFYPCMAHEPRHVAACLSALDPVFAELADAISCNDVQSRLLNGIRHTGFARLT